VIGGVILLVLLAGGLTFLLHKRPARRATDASPTALGKGAFDASAVDGKTSADRTMEQQISDNDAHQSQIESEALNRIKLPASTRKTEVLVKHIRESIQKDSTNVTNVLRSWITESETKRTI
jgi:flagellar biosynthesis/type III secretory pathway M-ring protein FliF/YscJ